jgi:hypothetical protein
LAQFRLGRFIRAQHCAQRYANLSKATINSTFESAAALDPWRNPA